MTQLALQLQLQRFTCCCCALAYAADSVPLNQFCALPGLTSSRFRLGDVPDLTPVTFKIFQLAIFYFFFNITGRRFEHVILSCPSFGSAYPGSGHGSSNLKRAAQTSLSLATLSLPAETLLSRPSWHFRVVHT